MEYIHVYHHKHMPCLSEEEYLQSHCNYLNLLYMLHDILVVLMEMPTPEVQVVIVMAGQYSQIQEDCD